MRRRIEYFTQYLHQLDRAIQDGAQIKGYFAWSLMDNFEYVLLCSVLFVAVPVALS
jgi:beta-glucosidase